MFKLTEAADLEKAGRSLANFFAKQAEEFGKSVSSHEQQAQHHASIANLHKTHAADHQAMHDAMDNSHELKGHMAKGAAFHGAAADVHTAMHKVHADEAVKCKTQQDALKAAATEWGAPGVATSLFSRSAAASGAPLTAASGNPFEDMVKETTAQLAKKTLETFDNDVEVKQFMRETIMKMVGEAIGNTIVPTAVSGVAPAAPGITAVPRGGQPPAPPAKPNVPLQFQKLVQVDEDEELAYRG